ncbi:MAG: phage Gp37/Gp68 family protein [Opitutales bacterium]|nr:phage Gp37/Gp68 family protein [Opitutales bacterium]
MEWWSKEVVKPLYSNKVRRHIWQWLTKRPEHFKKVFSKDFPPPENLCLMTTLTGPSKDNLARLKSLREAPGAMKGLSIEPLWERIPADQLDLTGIDWVIVGGESGHKDARPFDLARAREIRNHCQKNSVAFFLKQLGRNQVDKGKPIKLRDGHGGDWDEWPGDLKIREFPQAFHEHRKGKLQFLDGQTKERPAPGKKKPKKEAVATLALLRCVASSLMPSKRTCLNYAT